MKIEQECICQNCSNFFSDSRELEIGFGVCLRDEEFDSFSELLSHPLIVSYSLSFLSNPYTSRIEMSLDGSMLSILILYAS